MTADEAAGRPQESVAPEPPAGPEHDGATTARDGSPPGGRQGTARRRNLLCGIAVAVLVALLVVFRSHDAPYTALVVDAETGEPVEGAVYLAVWWKTTYGEVKPWWEGSAEVIEKFEEGRTGVDGIINVPGFWRRRIAFQPNTLTVYKPGYVLWFQEKIYPTYAVRTDFSREQRTIRLTRWKDTLSSPGMINFSITATKGDLNSAMYLKGKHLLYSALQDFESEFIRKRRTDK